MTEPRAFRRSRTERVVAIGTTVVSLALLGWVALDIFNSTVLNPQAANAKQIFDIEQNATSIDSDRSGGLHISGPVGAKSPPKPTPIVANAAIQTADQSPTIQLAEEGGTQSVDIGEPAKFDAVQQELTTMQSALRSAEEQVEILQANLLANEKALALLDESARAEIDGLKRSNSDLVTANEELQSQLTQTAKQLAGSQWRTRELAKKLDSLEQEIEQVAAEPEVPSHSQAQQAYREERYEDAAEMWSIMADAGDPKAQFHLGGLNYDGKLGQPNLTVAYRYLTNAIEGGFGPALALRQRVRNEMTATELAEASRGS